MIRGDLFTSDPCSSLAHCVSNDFKMSMGIASIFCHKFAKIDALRGTNARIGDIVVVRDGGRFIYNLVTKENYNDKPTYENLRHSITNMREHALKNNVEKISMPKIGCGLDGLSWPVVQNIIISAFRETSIKILVYHRG